MVEGVVVVGGWGEGRVAPACGARGLQSCEAERAYASEAWKVAAVTSARWPA